MLEEANLGVATTDGRTYFEITTLLKRARLAFTTIVPGEAIGVSVKVIITSKKEKSYFASRSTTKVLCIEDLDSDAGVVRERIFSEIFGNGNDFLVIGIDPGERTGVAVFFDSHEIDTEVFASVQETVYRVGRIIRASDAARKIVRVGNGIPGLATEICGALRRGFGSEVIIELVDEHGTSSTLRTHRNTRALRDKLSARIIAFRKGKRLR